MTTDTKSEPKAASTKFKSRATATAWAEVETLYELGDITTAEIAAKFGITDRAVKLHMQRRKIKAGSKAAKHAKKVTEQLEKASVTDAVIHAARIKSTKEDHYKMAETLGKLVYTETVKCARDGLPFSTMTNNVKALEMAISALAKVRAERYAILGLDRDDYVDEEGLPELVISELTADQVETLRNRDSGLEDIDADDVVQLDDGDNGVASE